MENSLVEFYINRVEQLQKEVLELRSQISQDWMICLEFKCSAHRLVLETVDSYKENGYNFYIERLESMKERLQTLESTEDSMINKFKQSHIAEIDNALEKIRELRTESHAII